MSTSETLLGRLHAKDEMTFALSDTLDTKASIALVVITFLGTQTAWFVTEKHVAGLWLAIQSLSASALVAAGALTIIALWPRKYDTEAAEGFDAWVEELRVFYKDERDPDAKVVAQMERGEIDLAKERIATNKRHNDRKSDLIEWSFWGSTVAFGLNLATVVALAIQRLS